MVHNFLELAIAGQVPVEAIDDYVEKWHRSSSGQSLPEFLGLSPQEYTRWVTDHQAIYRIVEHHRD